MYLQTNVDWRQLPREFAGRVEGFRLEVQDGRLRLYGKVRSYYVKQLVQEHVMRCCSLPIAENLVRVEPTETDANDDGSPT